MVGREARRARNARTRCGPGAMADSEADAMRARDEETLLLSPAGVTPPTPAELAARFPNLEVMELLARAAQRPSRLTAGRSRRVGSKKRYHSASRSKVST